MKIGIMGGTFDPIHNGHLMLGEYAYHQYQLDKVWFMPNGNPPHKSSNSIESHQKTRLEMVRLAIEEVPYFELQPYEVENQAIHYSYKTMEHFKEQYPNDQFYFIIGADSLFSIEKWVKPERLLQTCVMLAAYRDNKGIDEMQAQISYLNEKFHGDIRLLNTPQVDISSSEIREWMKEGKSIREAVPKKVFNYIKNNQLYGNDEV